MDVTLYLPDEIGKWAKENDINLSRTLRDQLEAIMEQTKAREAALKGASEVQLKLVNPDGHWYVGRFTGTLITEGGACGVYLTEDDRILVHDWNRDEIAELSDPEGELRGWLNDEAYVEACNALGIDPVIDI
jgi:hypothetical protein